MRGRCLITSLVHRESGEDQSDFTGVRKESGLGPFNTSNYVTSKQFFDKILTLELNEEKGTQENAGIDGGGGRGYN